MVDLTPSLSTSGEGGRSLILLTPSPKEKERYFIKTINIYTFHISHNALLYKVEMFNCILKFNEEDVRIRFVLMCCLLSLGEGGQVVRPGY